MGKAFAEKYTGFRNSVSAQLSLVELSLQQETLASLLKMGLALKAALPRSEVVQVTLCQCVLHFSNVCRCLCM